MKLDANVICTRRHVNAIQYTGRKRNYRLVAGYLLNASCRSCGYVKECALWSALAATHLTSNTIYFDFVFT